MRLYFGRSPDGTEDIEDQVDDFEAACAVIGMAALVAASGPEGFEEEELDVAMVGAAPAEVTMMVLHSLGKLVRLAWPDFDWT